MNLQERIKNTCQALGTVKYRSYSGRGMYGKQCVGIVGDWKDCQCLMQVVIGDQAQEVFDTARDATDESMDAAFDEHDDLQQTIAMIFDFRSDDMGLQSVVYWPNLEYNGDTMNDEEDEG